MPDDPPAPVSPPHVGLPAVGTQTTAPTAADLDRHVVETLAELRGCDATSIYQAMQNGGDCRIDSLEGVTVVTMLGQKLGGRQPGPDELQAKQFTSVKSLQGLISRLH